MNQPGHDSPPAQPTAQAPAPSLDDVGREVRFAAVMYGGVSLAIYINGVAQELYAMVRATSACGRDRDDKLTGKAKRADELTAVERVYRKLAYLLADAGLLERQRTWLAGGRPAGQTEPAAEVVDGQAPLGLRFVVDILSGTSAGGINGVFLAKALANDQPMDLLKQLWIHEGDMGLLLNDADSLADLPATLKLKGLGTPTSLLNSQRMYYKLLLALTEMDRSRPAAAPSPHVDELDLYVTATDIDGAVLPLRLADNVVFERRHRDVFRLRYAAPTTVSPRNDFTLAANPFLAFTARCTSSFPFAFEPMRLRDIEAVTGTLREYRNRPEARADHVAWRRHFEQTRDSRSGNEADDYRNRAYGDGGYLDNKPFSYATEALSRRQVDVPVTRKLIYIEPAPEHPEDEANKNALDGWPDALDNVLAALVGIPRYETIREDLERVLARNRRISRVRHITRLIEEDLEVAKEQGDALRQSAAQRNANWNDKPLAQMISEYGIYYLPYRRLRINAVTDDLARVLARVGGFKSDSDHLFALQCLVRSWRDAHYKDNPKANDEPKLETTNAFLTHFDVSYRLRRLQLVRGKLDQLSGLLRRLRTRDPEATHWPNERDASVIRQIDKALGADDALISLSASKLVEAEQSLRLFKRALNALYRRLRVALRTLRDGQAGTGDLAASVDGLGLDERHIDFLFGVPWADIAALADAAGQPGDRQPDAALRQESRRALRRSAATDGSLEALENDGLTRAGRLLANPVVFGLPEDFAARLANVFAILRTRIDRQVRRRISLCGARLLGESYAERRVRGGDMPWGLALLLRRVTLRHLKVEEIAAFQTFLRRYHEEFEEYDQIGFPIFYDTGSTTTDLVDVIRISPEDARNLIDERRPSETRRKLAGTTLSNFGAFLDRSWRQNDLMWGRLDGAERLIAALLPDSQYKALRTALIDEAQAAIAVEEMGVESHRELMTLLSAQLAEAVANAGSGSAANQAVERTLATLGEAGPMNKRLDAILRRCLTQEALFEHLKSDYEVNRALDPKGALRIASRTTHVTGRVLEGIAKRRGSGSRPFAGLAQFGKIMVGMVELAVPGSMLSALAVHWLSVLYIFEAFIIVGATLLTADSAQKFGWAAFGLTLGAHLILLLLDGLMRRWTRTIRNFARLLMLATLGFAAIGFDHVFALGLVARAKTVLGTMWHSIGNLFS